MCVYWTLHTSYTWQALFVALICRTEVSVFDDESHCLWLVYLLMCVFCPSSTIWHTKYITLEAGRLWEKAKLVCVFILSRRNLWEQCWLFKICLPKHSTWVLKWRSIRTVCFTSLILLSSWSKTNSFWNSHHNERMLVI